MISAVRAQFLASRAARAYCDRDEIASVCKQSSRVMLALGRVGSGPMIF